jgi:hypothetical protein
VATGLGTGVALTLGEGLGLGWVVGVLLQLVWRASKRGKSKKVCFFMGWELLVSL